MARSQRRGRYDYSPSPPRNRSCSRYRSFSRSCSPQRSDYSPSPPRNRSRLRYRSRSRSRSPRRYNSDDEDAHNPGNNLYVTGLSTRVTERDLEEFCSTEGKVKECHLVVDPRTKESRGFGFVTMETVEDAEYCIKYLNKSVFEGRVVTVEKNFYLDYLDSNVAVQFQQQQSNIIQADQCLNLTAIINQL